MPTIDADAHVVESLRTWDYMDESERSFRPEVIVSNRGQSKREMRDKWGRTPDRADFWLVDGRLHPKSQNAGIDTSEASREMHDVESRLRHMDELEVDIQVLYPTIFLRPVTKRPQVELALTRSYNRWMTDIWKKGRDRLRWVAVLPLLTLDKALTELRIAGENGACGFLMRGLEEEKSLTDPYFFPLYEEATRLDMPVCIHSGVGSFSYFELFPGEAGFRRFKLAVVGDFHSLIMEGIPQKFPELRFGFIEVSAQWLPYVIHDLKRIFERQGVPLAEDILRESRFYVACQTDDDLPTILKYGGEDNLVIGSDYGHADRSAEIEALRHLKQRGELDPTVVNKILDENPRILYGL